MVAHAFNPNTHGGHHSVWWQRLIKMNIHKKMINALLNTAENSSEDLKVILGFEYILGY